MCRYRLKPTRSVRIPLKTVPKPPLPKRSTSSTSAATSMSANGLRDWAGEAGSTAPLLRKGAVLLRGGGGHGAGRCGSGAEAGVLHSGLAGARGLGEDGVDELLWGATDETRCWRRWAVVCNKETQQRDATCQHLGLSRRVTMGARRRGCGKMTSAGAGVGVAWRRRMWGAQRSARASTTAAATTAQAAAMGTATGVPLLWAPAGAAAGVLVAVVAGALVNGVVLSTRGASSGGQHQSTRHGGDEACGGGQLALVGRACTARLDASARRVSPSGRA